MIKARYVMHKVSGGSTGRPGMEPQIHFSGFKVDEGEGYWVMPKKLVALLEGLGFEQQSDQIWTGPMDVDGFNMDEALQCVADYVDVTLVGRRKKLKKGYKTYFEASIDTDCHASMVGTLSEAASASEALDRAYLKWNRLGRPVKGVTALQAVLKELKQ